MMVSVFAAKDLTFKNFIWMLVALLLGMAPLANAQAATSAAQYKKDFAAAAAKGKVKFNTIPALNDFLGKNAAKPFADMEISNVTAVVNDAKGFTLIGDVVLGDFTMKMRLYVVGSSKPKFVASLIPTGTLDLAKMLRLSGAAKTAFSTIFQPSEFKNLALMFGTLATEVKSADMPAAMIDDLKSLYGFDSFNPSVDSFTLKSTDGLTMIAGIDLGIGPLKDVLGFIGATSTSVTLTGSLAPNLLAALKGRKAPNPSISLSAQLPAFKPQLGNAVRIPTEIKLAYSAKLDSKGKGALGFSGTFTLPLGGIDVPMKLVSGVEIDPKNLKSKATLSAIISDGKPWNPAFGAKWLTIEDYTIAYEIEAEGSKDPKAPTKFELGIGMSGKTILGGKKFTVGGAVAIDPKTAGTPIPKEIELAVEGVEEKEVGSISLRDIMSIAVALGIPYPSAIMPPDEFIQLRGTEPGKGPNIKFEDINDPKKIKMEMGGELVVFGKPLATVDEAFVSVQEGISIKAHMDQAFKIGPFLEMPTADVDISLRLPDGKGTIFEPKVIITGTGSKILGQQVTVELEITKDKQIASAHMSTLFGIVEADITLEGKADLSNPGFKFTGLVIGDIFGKISDGMQIAAAAITEGTEAMVQGMNDEVHKFSGNLIDANLKKQKILDDIDAAADSARAELESAKRDVNSIRGEYDRARSKCGWLAPWWCAEEGVLWVAMKTANGFLSLAQGAVDLALTMAREAASAILTAIEKTIQTLGKAIDTATQGLTAAFKAVGNVMSFAANLVGDAMEALASLFNITKLWMMGDLSAMSSTGKSPINGNLGVEYTILGNDSSIEFGWNFRNPITDVVGLLGGSKKGENQKPAPLKPLALKGAKDYGVPVVSNAHSVVEAMIQRTKFSEAPMPYNPKTCEVYPYLLDAQLADARQGLKQAHKNRYIAYLRAYIAAYNQWSLQKDLAKKSPLAPSVTAGDRKRSAIDSVYRSAKSAIHAGSWKALKSQQLAYAAYVRLRTARRVELREMRKRKTVTSKPEAPEPTPWWGPQIKMPAMTLPKNWVSLTKKQMTAYTELIQITERIVKATPEISKYYRAKRREHRKAAAGITKKYKKLIAAVPQKTYGSSPFTISTHDMLGIFKLRSQMESEIDKLPGRKKYRAKFKVLGKTRTLTAPYMPAIRKEQVAEYSKLVKRLEILEKDPESVCGQAEKASNKQATKASKKAKEEATAAVWGGGAFALAMGPSIAGLKKQMRAAAKQQAMFSSNFLFTKRKPKAEKAKKRHADILKKKNARAVKNSQQALATAQANAKADIKHRKAYISRLKRRLANLPNREKREYASRWTQLRAAQAAIKMLPAKAQRARKAKNKKLFAALARKAVATEMAARKVRLTAALAKAQAGLTKAQALAKDNRKLAKKLVALTPKQKKALLPQLKKRFGSSRRGLKAIASGKNPKAIAMAIKRVTHKEELKARLAKRKNKKVRRNTEFLKRKAMKKKAKDTF